MYNAMHVMITSPTAKIFHQLYIKGRRKKHSRKMSPIVPNKFVGGLPLKEGVATGASGDPSPLDSETTGISL